MLLNRGGSFSDRCAGRAGAVTVRRALILAGVALLCLWALHPITALAQLPRVGGGAVGNVGLPGSSSLPNVGGGGGSGLPGSSSSFPPSPTTASALG